MLNPDQNSSLFLDTLAEGIYGTDNNGVCTFANQSFRNMLGYQDNDEFLGKYIHELIHHTYPDGSPYPESECRACCACRSGPPIMVSDEVFWRKDGIAVPVEYWSQSIIEDGKLAGTIVIFVDANERKNSESKIRRLTQLYTALSQCNEAIVRSTSEQELFQTICRIAVDSGGMRMAWIGLLEAGRQIRPVTCYGAGTDYLDGILISAEADDPFGGGPVGTAIRNDQPFWCQDCEHDTAFAPWRERSYKFGWKACAALPLHRNGIPSGVLSLYSDTINTFDEDSRHLLIEMATDISFALENFDRESQRRRAEQEIILKNTWLQTQLEASLDAILMVDGNQKILSYNQQFIDLWRLPPELVQAGEDEPVLQAVVAQTENPEEFLAHARFLLSHPEARSRDEIRLKDGRIIDRYTVAITGAEGQYHGRVAYFRDITESRQAAQELADSEQRFRGLVEQSLAGIYIIQDNRVIYANPRAVEILGQNSADDLIKRDPLSFVAEADRSKVAEAMRKLFARERDKIALEFSALFRDGTEIVVGANASYASYHGKPSIIGLIQDISEKKHDEERIMNYVVQLKTTILSTVQLATSLSEMRDPYTAGHERRVAEIAVAIAIEMDLDEQRLEGIKVAGFLHDIGKISIPAEILVKPGRLTATEYALVQGHAQASYDVLKHVEFPWPIAAIALQHHERIDGSGYPNGLKGDEMLLESRIMAVADVVEAMASHRPYRPGLGIERALAELERGRGSAYDPEVVDICLRLFRDQSFELPPY